MDDLICTYCGQAGHRASQCPQRPAAWPFPARLLDYPSLPPGVKPVRAAPQPKLAQDLPPALF
jgi:hypothetical protein